MSGTESEQLDPFDPSNVGAVQLIVLMRIYDVLMAQLTLSDQEMAANLLELHAKGQILGPLPSLDLRNPEDA